MSSKVKNLVSFSLSFVVIVIFSSCTGLIEGFAENNIKGGWNSSVIEDDATKVKSDVNINSNNFILGNKAADALFFNEDGTFTAFRQKNGNSGNASGTYSIDVLTLTMNFTGQSPIKRSLVSVGEAELIMRDTIFGVPKTITYLR